MKALATIGWNKALRFIWYSFYAALVRSCVLPPLRVWLLRLAGAQIGRDTVIFNVSYSNLYHYGFRYLTIGSRCFLGDEVMLDVRGKIMLADDVTLSNRTNVVTHINVGYPDHPLQRVYPTKEEFVRIGRGTYIGTAATILPGVTIGRESVVGAGAVVTRDVADQVMVAGVPARVIKQIRH